MKIDRPIIVIGTGRCGSTIVFEALARHEQLCWFSNFNDRYPRVAAASVVHRLYDLPFLRNMRRGEKRQHKQGGSPINRYLPKPAESYNKWESMCGSKFRDDFLVGVKATPDERMRVRRAVGQVLFWHGKPRFATKITGPSRIEYLHSIFDDAIFVDVVRDGRAVVNSLLHSGFWEESGAFTQPKWSGGLPGDWGRQWEGYGGTPMALAAMQYRAIMEITQRERQLLGPDQYIRILYEDYTRDPQSVMDRILSFCDLGPSPNINRYVTEQGRYESMNTKYLKNFSKEDLEILEQILGPWLEPFKAMASS